MMHVRILCVGKGQATLDLKVLTVKQRDTMLVVAHHSFANWMDELPAKAATPPRCSSAIIGYEQSPSYEPISNIESVAVGQLNG
jgi:hypothetical protein